MPRVLDRLRIFKTPLGLVTSVLITLAVAAVALTALDHHRSARRATAPVGVQGARQQLIAAFGILRRPQTKADLDPSLFPGPLGFYLRFGNRHGRPPEGLLRRWGNPSLDRPLIRVVQIPVWQAKVGFEPATFQPSASSPRRIEGLDLGLWTGLARTIPPSTEDGTGPRPTSVPTLLAHGLALTGGPDGRDGIVVVPDGVARVSLGPIRLIRSPAKVDPSQFGTVTARVHDNIAAFRIPVLRASNRTRHSGLYGVPAIAQAVWFDAAGNVIRHTTTQLDLIIKIPGKTPFPQAPPVKGLFCQENPGAC